MQLAAVIDEHAQAGDIPAGRAKHAAAMLMVIRDYIQPLPVGGDESHDQVTPDLAEIVTTCARSGGKPAIRGKRPAAREDGQADISTTCAPVLSAALPMMAQIRFAIVRQFVLQ